MKVLYAIQGTGNGHLGRAIEIAPHLKELVDVDFMISGKTAELKFPYDFKYTYHGIYFFFGSKGGVDYYNSFKHLRLPQLWRDIKACPVEDYDVIISDFEPISAWAARRKKIPVIALSHQASFYSEKVPFPKFRNRIFEYGMKHWVAPSDDYVGLHYKPYDEQILPPIIREELKVGRVTDEGHLTVYLPAFSDELLIKHFSKVPELKVEIFSKKTTVVKTVGNCQVSPVSKSEYTSSLLSCRGLLTGGGFQSTSEALYLRKRLLVIPMFDQYEQKCNAAALSEMGVTIVRAIKSDFSSVIKKWLENRNPIHYTEYAADTNKVAEKICQVAKRLCSLV